MNLSAQDITRDSLSGEDLALQLREQGNTSSQAYNLKLGPVALRVDATLSISANDNIGLTKDNRTADLILTPSADLRGAWTVSDLNTLNFDLGIGYQAYMFHSQYNSVTLSPNSQASFNFFVGDVAINLFDGFSYQQDPAQVAQISNQVQLDRFSNDAGISAKWDLSSFIFSISYDHANLWVTQSIYDYLSNQSDTVSPKFAIPIDKTTEVGVQASFSSVRYQQGVQNNYLSESVEPYASLTLSSDLSLNVQGGGYFSQFANTGSNQDSTSNSASFVGSLGVNHKINSALSQALTFGREQLPGITSNYTDRIYANYGDSWQATKTINVGPSLFWENLTDSSGSFRETSNRYGVGLNVADALSEHFNVSVNYQMILKDSNPSFDSYFLNVGTLNMQYNF